MCVCVYITLDFRRLWHHSETQLHPSHGNRWLWRHLCFTSSQGS